MMLDRGWPVTANSAGNGRPQVGQHLGRWPFRSARPHRGAAAPDAGRRAKQQHADAIARDFGTEPGMPDKRARNDLHRSPILGTFRPRFSLGRSMAPSRSRAASAARSRCACSCVAPSSGYDFSVMQVTDRDADASSVAASLSLLGLGAAPPRAGALFVVLRR